MRIVFLGTPQFAVPSLEALVQGGHQVLAVYTQPDRPKGRGNQLAESPVKITANRRQVPVRQPERIRRPENLDPLRDLQAEIMVVVGYGQIIPQSIIDLPRFGILNVHGSLLPKYRGAAPIQWAIANGEKGTGVTIMQIDAGLDTGAMLLKEELKIAPDETAPELGARMASLGASLLMRSIKDLAAGRSRPEKQNGAEATYAPILTKDDGRIDWQLPAAQIYNRLRGFNPWPGASSTFRRASLTIVTAKPIDSGLALQPGEMAVDRVRLLVGCGARSILQILELQPAGKKRMSADAFINGYKPSCGESFTSPIPPVTT